MTFRRFMIEGGAAIKQTSSINLINIEATLNDVYSKLLPLLSIATGDTVVLGSASRNDPLTSNINETSGDIDLAVKISAFAPKTPEEIFTLVKQAADSLGLAYKSMPGIDVISIGWPISDTDGKQTGQHVQLDIMPVGSVEWAKWSYYSPAPSESQYKGLYRNEVMFYCCRNLDMNVTHSVDGEPAIWARYFYDLNKGILRGAQTRVGEKGELNKSVKTTDKVLVTDDPDEAVKLIFGPHYKAQDILTWEQALEAMQHKDFPLKDKLPLLYRGIADGITRKKYPIPPDLKVFL